MPSFANFISTQLILKIPLPTSSFASKVVIITGGSSGLGKEAAKHIVRLGASKVIIACRNTDKGKSVKLELESALQCNSDILEVWQVDIESPPSIKTFVERANKLPRLDVVINNAGINLLDFETSYDTERVVAVNVVGTFLLALQLLPKLKKTSKSIADTTHMTFLGSALYDAAKYPEQHGDNIFDWLKDKDHVANMMNQYNLSKLMLNMAIIKLVSEGKWITSDSSKTPVIINVLDPCFCKTELARELTGGLRTAYNIFAFLFARTAEEGSRLVVKAATEDKVTHGMYLRGGSVQQYIDSLKSDEGVKRCNLLWEQLIEKLEQLQPGFLEIVSQ